MAPKVVIALMWAGAFASATAIWLTRSRGEEREPAVAAPGETVHLQDVPSVAPPRNLSDSVAYRMGARHAGTTGLTGPAEGRIAWTFETGGRITAQVVASRAGEIYVGSHDHFFYALDRAGRERWKRDLGGRIYSTAAVDRNGHVYIGSDAGSVWSFDRRGEQRWRLDVDSDADTAIVLSGERIVFAAGRAVWAVALDGEVAWRRELSGKVFTAPLVDGAGHVFVGCQDDNFYRLDDEGSVVWTYRTAGDNDGSPAMDEDGNLYFGSDDNHVYSLSSDGALRWSTDLDGMVRAPVAVHGGRVLAGVFGPRPRIVSLDGADGTLQWYFPVTVADTTEIGVASGPVIDGGGAIYFGAHDDYIYSIASDGALRWVVPTDGDVDASPAILPGALLVVGSDDGKVYAVRGGR
ncbi:MAG: PQQ-binding-like beta-propeller repeat protein [Myxococcota bacterium]